MVSNNPLPAIISLGVLFSINILMISSLSPTLMFKQIFAWLIGIALFFIGKQLDPKQTKSVRWLIFFLSCFFLFLPIILNNVTRGSRRWIDLGPLPSIQPSEVVKPFLMLFLSNTHLPLIHLIPIGIIMLQPDLGSAISVLFLLAPIILHNKKLFKIAGLIFIITLLASPLIWNNVLHDYQKSRVVTFLNPSADPLGEGYNVIQSKIAIGSGGLFGKGYKKGSQGQLLFLPEKHTDFMFSAAAEELGLVGVGAVLVSYFMLIKYLIDKAYSTKDKALFLFTLGIALQIWMQVFVNIGMNLGLLPVTGIPLPFISVGGSSLMSLLFALGIIFSS